MTYGPVRIKDGVLGEGERQFAYGASRISLCQSADGEPGREYLERVRELDVETIAKFRLGYVPFSVNHPLSGRIIMPIFDMQGSLIALSARPIWDFTCNRCSKMFLASQLKTSQPMCPACQSADVSKNEPKYWNESFSKGEHLYGLSIAASVIPKMKYAIVVEGQMDVLTLHSHGFANTVGILGGAFTHVHALLLKRWTSQVVVLFDADSAGKEHTSKCLELLSAYNAAARATCAARSPATLAIRVATATLPNGYDPDSFVRERGAGQLRELVSMSMQMSGFRLPAERK
jgi:DNA primase